MYPGNTQVKKAQRGADKSAQMKVTTGSWVSIVELGTGEMQEFKVVGTLQPGVRFDEVSSWSPLGKALLGCKVGESIYVEAPKGTVRYEILKITEDR